MNEILFIVGDLPIHVRELLIGFGALALVLLLVIAIVIARSGRRRTRSETRGRRSGLADPARCSGARHLDVRRLEVSARLRALRLRES